MSYVDMPGEYDPNVSPYLLRPLRMLEQAQNKNPEPGPTDDPHDMEHDPERSGGSCEEAGAGLTSHGGVVGANVSEGVTSRERPAPYLRRAASTHPHPCPHCKRRFARTRDLEQHQAMKHGEAA